MNQAVHGSKSSIVTKSIAEVRKKFAQNSADQTATKPMASTSNANNEPTPAAPLQPLMAKTLSMLQLSSQIITTTNDLLELMVKFAEIPGLLIF